MAEIIGNLFVITSSKNVHERSVLTCYSVTFEIVVSVLVVVLIAMVIVVVVVEVAVTGTAPFSSLDVQKHNTLKNKFKGIGFKKLRKSSMACCSLDLFR